jgi:hypothetical protein
LTCCFVAAASAGSKFRTLKERTLSRVYSLGFRPIARLWRSLSVGGPAAWTCCSAAAAVLDLNDGKRVVRVTASQAGGNIHGNFCRTTSFDMMLHCSSKHRAWLQNPIIEEQVVRVARF